MIVLDAYYPCSFSKLAFKSIIDYLSVIKKSIIQNSSDVSFLFIDGDSVDIHFIIKNIYDLRQKKKHVYTITLLQEIKGCSTVIKHFSDLVVEKKITYHELQRKIEYISCQNPKALEDDVFGDIWGDLLKLLRKEQQVLNLLLNGHNQYQIANMLNLSTKTISAYKIKAVKRHGARNFNELYLSKKKDV